MSYNPPKKNTAYIFYTGLIQQADTRLLKSSPTLAAGDFKVSIDGGALANLATLPAVTPAASTMVKFSLSAAEMNGDNITIVCIDAAGAEWCDQIINIQTSVKQFDDILAAADVRSAVGLASANLDTQIAAVQADTDNIQTRLPAALVSGRMDASVGAMANDVVTDNAISSSAITEIQAGLSTLNAAGVRTAVGLASANLDTQLAAVQADTDNIQTRLPAALVSGRIDASVGAIADDTITDNAISGSAVTEIQAGLSTLNAAGVRAAVGLASANLDTQLDALPTAIENADALLARNQKGGATSSPTVSMALAAGLMLVERDETTLTVKHGDGTTAFTRDLTGDAALEPIATSDAP